MWQLEVEDCEKNKKQERVMMQMYKREIKYKVVEGDLETVHDS
jgi:hypothetical protein